MKELEKFKVTIKNNIVLLFYFDVATYIIELAVQYN